MNINTILKKAVDSGKTALSEHESKKILHAYGIPVVQETVAKTIGDAVEAASQIGFPIVLKGLGARLTHKTERGLVHMHLKTVAEVRSAAESIQHNAGDDLEGFLVQPQIQGKREWIAGLSHDEQFGPVIMFGAGGILTEAVSDVTFRLAPLSPEDAREMIAEIKSSPLLEDFRGEKKIDRSQIVRVLTGLSDLAADHPEVFEVDINPLIATATGDLLAVDALVVVGGTHERTVSPGSISQTEALGPFFYPKSIAFIGASSTMGKWGHMLVANTKSGGYAGKIYLVNPKGGKIVGEEAYRSLSDIHEPVDLAIVTIPAEHVISLIPQLQANGIRHMLLITSGFSETDSDGKKTRKRTGCICAAGRNPDTGPQHHGDLQSPCGSQLHQPARTTETRLHRSHIPIRKHGHPVPGLCRASGNRYPWFLRIGQ